MPLHIIIAGAPASGKGTQCERIREDFGVVHLSTGDMLRAAVAAGTEVGLKAKAFMESGQLVPDEVIIGIIQDRLKQDDCMKKGWLLDGFPRTRAQADALSDAGVTADIFVLLDVPDSALVERVVGRRTDPVTGKIYHMTFSPPENEEIAARLTQRADDTEEKVVTRLENYHKNLAPILEVYPDILVRVDGNRNKNEIYKKIKTLLSKREFKPLKIVIAGAPASGKGTQCERIREDFGVVHLSTGDMLRAAVAAGTDVGLKAKEYMESGQLVPDEVIIGVVKDRLAEKDCIERGWLLDGFPRTRAQADAMREALIVPDIFLLLNVPDAALVERVVGRRTDPVTGKIYHMTFSPPENEEVAARLTQRADDTEEKVVTRLENYHKNLNPILEVYKDITVQIDGNRNKDGIYEEVTTKLEEARPKALKIIISGAPASGKGTHCENIRAQFGVVHLSTGDMLRAAVAAQTEVGLQAKSYMESGQLVPDAVIIGIINERLKQADCQKRGWLLDGFPRTRAQADALAAAGIVADIFILLDVPDAALVERVVGRRTDPVTGKIYHMTFSPPETEEIAARLTQRADDTEEKVVTRLENYHKNLAPIIEVYTDIMVRIPGDRKKADVYLDVVNNLKRVEKYEVIFVLGGPGCGKGTQCAKITKAFGFCHLSAGDLLRAERNSGSPLAEMINNFIAEGKIVPAEVTVGLLRTAMRKANVRKFLVDGFPRNEDNLNCWLNIMGKTSNILYTLFFDAPDSVMEERIMERSKTSGRIDDNIETIRKRLRTFHEGTMPVVDKLKLLGVVREISATPPPDVVFAASVPLFKGAVLSPPFGRTLAMIKPDAVGRGKADAIIENLENQGFFVVARKSETLSRIRAEEFYAEHKGKSFFDSLIEFMTSGESIALLLEKENAVQSYRAAMEGIRAEYGTNATQNAVHGSDSIVSMLREAKFWFPDGLEKEQTLAMIKANSADLHGEEIVGIMAAHGFRVVKSISQTLSPAMAGAFYAEHQGRPFYESLVQYMSSAKSMQLILEREGAIKAWRAVQGPTSAETARKNAPFSVRALFGTDSTANATHGSDSEASANREIAFFFPGDKRVIPQGASQVEADTLKYLSETVDPIMSTLLERILISRPADVAGFAAEALKQL